MEPEEAHAAGGIRERPLAIPSAGFPLCGFLHRPARARGAVLIVPPIFDERNGAQRTLVDLARALARAGFAALRFDPRGVGDSPGGLEGVTLAAWRADVRAALAALRAETGSSPTALVGLRFGAALAFSETASLDVPAAVLLEPVLEGHSYLRSLLQLRALRRGLTAGGSAATLMEEVLREDPFDLDGFAVPAALAREIAALDLRQNSPAFFPGKLLLVQISGAQALNAANTGWTQRLAASGAKIETAVLRLPPFWSQVERVDTGELVRLATEWIAQP